MYQRSFFVRVVNLKTTVDVNALAHSNVGVICISCHKVVTRLKLNCDFTNLSFYG